jgi:hypothetical protein
MVETPVGARCPTCAGVKRFALVVKPAELVRAIAYGIGVAALGTLIYTFVPFLGPLISFAVVGFGVGQVVSLGTNRKRARELAPIAVACLFIGYEIGLVARFAFESSSFDPALLLLPILALRQGLTVVGLGMGALLAWMRVR